MKNRKTKKIPTRDEYKEKFDRLFSELNYIPQEINGIKEKIVQCGYPYPDYWFFSNMGYLFSVCRKKIEILKPYGSPMGLKNKDGNRLQNDWYYHYISRKTGKKEKARMYQLLREYFLVNEFKDLEEYKDCKEDVHHIISKTKFDLNEPQKCNNVANTQLLPKAIHKEVTHYTNMTEEKEEKELRKKLKKMKNPTTIVVEGNLTEWAIDFLQKNFELGNHAYIISGNADDGMTAKVIDSVTRYENN